MEVEELKLLQVDEEYGVLAGLTTARVGGMGVELKYDENGPLPSQFFLVRPCVPSRVERGL